MEEVGEPGIRLEVVRDARDGLRKAAMNALRLLEEVISTYEVPEEPRVPVLGRIQDGELRTAVVKLYEDCALLMDYPARREAGLHKVAGRLYGPAPPRPGAPRQL